MKLAYHFCSFVCLMLLFAPWAYAGSATQGLEQQVSPDERERMHKDMDDYATKAYPDHGHLEERRKLQERFSQADINEDNVISREEAEQRLPWLASHFDEIDTDNDGTISREELQIAEDKIREEKARRLKEVKEQQQQQLAREETEQDATAVPKKKHIKHHPKPPPEDSKPAPTEDNGEGS
jgi:hypothetical protein